MTVELKVYKELSKALSNTRDSLVNACYPRGIDSTTLDITKLTVEQCDDCSVWLPHNQMIDGTCTFCTNMDELRF